MNRLSEVQAASLRGLGRLISPGGRRGSLLVLTYHRVLPEPDPLLLEEPDAREFAAQMDIVAEMCRVLPLSEAIDRLVRASLPERAACITFDDGYANNLRLAARILKERRLPATVFISTGFIGDGRMWNDTVIESLRRADGVLDLCDLALGRFVLDGQMARRRAIETILGALKYLPGAERLARACVIAERVGEDLPGDLMMTEAEIRQIQSLDVEIGAHTVSHPILKSLDADTARHEIAASKHVLEAIARAPVTAFAYPNGRPGRDYDASHVKMVRQTGFTAAVSTSWGAADRRSDRLQVPRMLPWEKSALGFAVRLLRARLGPRAETA